MPRSARYSEEEAALMYARYRQSVGENLTLTLPPFARLTEEEKRVWFWTYLLIQADIIAAYRKRLPAS